MYFSVICSVLLITIVKADTGFVNISNTVNQYTLEVCSEYNPSFAPYPKEIDNNTKGTPVVDIYPDPGCEAPQDPKLYEGKIVIMKRHKNCTFAARAVNVQNANGVGVLVVSDDPIISPAANDSEYNQIHITVSLISNDSYLQFDNMITDVGIENVFIKLYAPETAYWDPNSVIMWLLAVFTCSLGAYLQASFYDSQVKAARKALREGGPAQDTSKDDEMSFTVIHAIIFFGMCSVMILLMYFFYKYMVYVIIGIFCLASCFSTYDFLDNIFGKSSCFTRHRICENKIPVFNSRPPILSICLFLACAAFAIFWAVERKEPYAWILQDILGFTFCIHMIKQIRLPSYKISTILLILFFIYDVFYVFITPLFTKNKESIMVNIATGGGGSSSEELPMLFKMPRFRKSPYSKCGPPPYSLLGYGDVILPGLHVGFCAVWDLRISNTVRRHAYYIAAIIGYATGLVLTFVGMYLTMMGQPALLYLTPCCLLSTLVVAVKRKELRPIWAGKLPVKSRSTSVNPPRVQDPNTPNEADSLLRTQA
ncbi:signal peptide peptidase-like 2B [Styela clava]